MKTPEEIASDIVVQYMNHDRYRVCDGESVRGIPDEVLLAQAYLTELNIWRQKLRTVRECVKEQLAE